jgi:hypothetical protein
MTLKALSILKAISDTASFPAQSLEARAWNIIFFLLGVIVSLDNVVAAVRQASLFTVMHQVTREYLGKWTLSSMLSTLCCMDSNLSVRSQSYLKKKFLF